MKKLVRKLALSIVAVAFAAVTLATSTFAWFSMNDKVQVQNLEINVVNKSQHLIIGITSDLDELQTDNLVEVSAVNSSATLQPSAHNEDVGTGVTEFSWYKMDADSPDASTSTKDPTTITEENYDAYILVNKFYITVAKGSAEMKNLKVEKCEISTADEGKVNAATRVLVISGIASEEFNSDNTEGTIVLAETLDETTVIEITVILYYDGNDTTVYTNNLLNLAGAEVNITFIAE